VNVAVGVIVGVCVGSGVRVDVLVGVKVGKSVMVGIGILVDVSVGGITAVGIRVDVAVGVGEAGITCGSSTMISFSAVAVIPKPSRRVPVYVAMLCTTLPGAVNIWLGPSVSAPGKVLWTN